MADTKNQTATSHHMTEGADAHTKLGYTSDFVSLWCSCGHLSITRRTSAPLVIAEHETFPRAIFNVVN